MADTFFVLESVGVLGVVLDVERVGDEVGNVGPAVVPEGNVVVGEGDDGSVVQEDRGGTNGSGLEHTGSVGDGGSGGVEPETVTILAEDDTVGGIVHHERGLIIDVVESTNSDDASGIGPGVDGDVPVEVSVLLFHGDSEEGVVDSPVELTIGDIDFLAVFKEALVLGEGGEGERVTVGSDGHEVVGVVEGNDIDFVVVIITVVLEEDAGSAGTAFSLVIDSLVSAAVNTEDDALAGSGDDTSELAGDVEGREVDGGAAGEVLGGSVEDLELGLVVVVDGEDGVKVGLDGVLDVGGVDGGSVIP